MVEHGYQHREGFCLMLYQGKESQRVVDIWNSRDGVTPFMCWFEGEEYRHIAFQFDRCVPNHRPRPGDYFWRNMTYDEALVMATQRVDRMSPELSPREREDVIEDVARDIFHDGEAPMLERVPFPMVAVGSEP